MEYWRWRVTGIEVTGHTEWFTWAQAVYNSKYGQNRNKPVYTTYHRTNPPQGSMIVGGTKYDPIWCSGFEFRSLIDSTPVDDVFIPFEWKDSENNGSRWRKSKKNGDIVFGALNVGRGHIRGIPFTVEPTTPPTATWSSSKIMGYDGNFYYDAANATNSSGAWARIKFTYRFDRVNVQPSTLSPSVNWVGHPTTWYEENILPGLVTSVLASANSGEMDVLTELAELPETVKWLIDILRGVPKIIKAFKDRKAVLEKKLKKAKKTAVEIADAVASLWLQYRYALMPIFYSIEDIRSALKAYKRIFAKYRSKEVEEIEIPFASLGYEFTGSAVTTHRCLIKRAYAPEDLIDRLLDILKLNPIATAWELVSLSFVVDWFVNIGDVIDALTGYDSSIQSAACYSWRTRISGSLIHEDTSQEIEIDCDSYRRIVIDPLTHVGLSLNFNLTWKQKVDALALLWGPLSKSLKESLK